MSRFQLDRRSAVLIDESGRMFDGPTRTWKPGAERLRGDLVDLAGAVHWLQRESGFPVRVPIGVIGPNEATPDQLRAAREIGARLARLGLTIICGGRLGVMEGVCRGGAAYGGVCIGLLPGEDPAEANPYVTIPIATGIGEARNAIIARSALCLIAVGDSPGTLSEVALGLRFGKPVFGIAGAADVEGVRQCADVAALIDAVARIVLALPE